MPRISAWVPDNMQHLVVLDKRFLKQLFGLPKDHYMDNCDMDVRRVFVGEMLLDSGYKCDGVADIKRFDDDFRPKWEELYAYRASPTFRRAPEGVQALGVVAFQRGPDSWWEPMGKWMRPQ